MAKTLLYVGSSTGGLGYVGAPKGRGIAAYWVDLDNGAAESIGATFVDNPTFVAIAPGGRSLVAVSEMPGVVEGQINAYAIDPASGALTAINRVGARGYTTAHAGFDKTGKYVAAANYGGVPVTAPAAHEFCVYRVSGSGSLSALTGEGAHKGTGGNPQRQERPHGHCVRWSPDNRFLLVADLGIDRVVIYRFDETTGAVTRHGEAVLPPGSGPRHFTFHPNGRLLYVSNELTLTVATFAYDPAAGACSLLGTTSTLTREPNSGDSCSAIAITGDGKYLFVANRGDNSVARFELDGNGMPSLLGTTPCGGRTPRDFALAPGEGVLVVANQDSDVISLFRRDGGTLTPLSEIASRTPMAIAFVSP